LATIYDLKDLSSTLRRPGKVEEEPIDLFLYPDNTIGASFVPQESGEHFVSVLKNGCHVTGSPFSLNGRRHGKGNALVSVVLFYISFIALVFVECRAIQ